MRTQTHLLPTHAPPGPGLGPTTGPRAGPTRTGSTGLWTRVAAPEATHRGAELLVPSPCPAVSPAPRPAEEGNSPEAGPRGSRRRALRRNTGETLRPCRRGPAGVSSGSRAGAGRPLALGGAPRAPALLAPRPRETPERPFLCRGPLWGGAVGVRSQAALPAPRPAAPTVSGREPARPGAHGQGQTHPRSPAGAAERTADT